MSKGMLFYRCLLCRRVVSQWDVKEHKGCKQCGGRKLSPTNLSFWEKIVQVMKHPKVWAWDDDEDIIDPPDEEL
jgi:DNA-directed RNA polymerase subunit RPC12/RpoP